MTFATFDPTAKSSHITLSGGNLIATSDGSANYFSVACTQVHSAGLWYCELTPLTSFNPSWFSVGLHNVGLADGLLNGRSNATGIGWVADGIIYRAGTGKSYGATWIVGDVIGILWDGDLGTLHFVKNGEDQGLAYSSVFGPLLIIVSGLGAFSVRANFGSQELYIQDIVPAVLDVSVIPNISVGTTDIQTDPVYMTVPEQIILSSVIPGIAVGTVYTPPDLHFETVPTQVIDASVIPSISVGTTDIEVDPISAAVPEQVIDASVIPGIVVGVTDIEVDPVAAVVPEQVLTSSIIPTITITHSP